MSNKKHYWVISFEDYDVDWDQFSFEDVRDSVINGLEANVKYISVQSQQEEEEYKVYDLDDALWIEVINEDGTLNIEGTANQITKDFIANKAIIAVRFEKDMYDELGRDCSWIDNILEDK